MEHVNKAAKQVNNVTEQVNQAVRQVYKMGGKDGFNPAAMATSDAAGYPVCSPVAFRWLHSVFHSIVISDEPRRLTDIRPNRGLV